VSVWASDPDRDFSGKWTLDAAASDIRSLGQVESSLTVSQSDAAMLISTGPLGWSYALDGSETRKRLGDESWNSVVKWEGSALLVNTLVSGPRDYTVMDRWTLSRDRGTLTIGRQIVRAGGESEGRLVFRREGASVAAAGPPAAEAAPAKASPASQPASDLPPPALAKRTEPGTPPDVTVPKGTRVLLVLVSEVSTKHAKEGDRVYLRTDAPVAANGRVAIPRWSDVSGTITRTKPAGRVAGRGELYIRFDSLILPNGVSRDFHARPPGDEGKVEGNGKSADGGAVLAGAGMGATVGAITRGLPGAAVGGAAGALAGVLLTRNQDVVLRQGTHLEMVLDRDLVFHPDELRNTR
jgi:type IV secretion system protein VirB10